MRGLYCTSNTAANQHINYLLSHYRDTAVVVDNEAAALACLAVSDYDLLLLEYKEDGTFSLDQFTTIAAVARQLRPCCVVVLYCDYPPVSTAVHNTLPKPLYDLGISETFDMSALLHIIDVWRHRRRFFSDQGQTTPNIRGIIFGPDLGMNLLYYEQLNRMGFEIILSADIDILEKHIDALQPDFFFSHCHTPQGNFDRVKKLCQQLRVSKPACTLFITVNSGVDKSYKEEHRLKEYGYDHLIDRIILVPELLSLIFEWEAKKYLLTISG